jgi:hypothetical protein
MPRTVKIAKDGKKTKDTKDIQKKDKNGSKKPEKK